MTELEKMDALRQRFNTSYANAKEALRISDGDIAQAAVWLENQGTAIKDTVLASEQADPAQPQEKSESFVQQVIEQVKGIINEGKVTRIRLKHAGHTLVDIPATVGIIGISTMLFSPLTALAAAVGTISAMKDGITLEVEKADGSLESRNLKWPERTLGSEATA